MSFIFSKDKNIVDISKDVVSLIKNEILYNANKIKRTYWTNEKIDNLFGKRSAMDIAYDKTTCFMNPCLDLTMLSSGLMLVRNIPHTLVIEEHLPTKEFNFNRLHFALEFQNENKKYTLNYKRCNEVYLSEGNYNGREDIPRAQFIRIPGESIDPDKSLSENLGYKKLEDLIKNKFKGYSLESNLNRLKQDNSEENYKLYNAKYGGDLQLIIIPQNQP